MEEIKVSEMTYADDMVLIARDEKMLNKNVRIYNRALKTINMKINDNKTKIMVISNKERKHQINVEEEKLEQVKSFKYLGIKVPQDG